MKAAKKAKKTHKIDQSSRRSQSFDMTNHLHYRNVMSTASCLRKLSKFTISICINGGAKKGYDGEKSFLVHFFRLQLLVCRITAPYTLNQMQCCESIIIIINGILMVLSKFSSEFGYWIYFPGFIIKWNPKYSGFEAVYADGVRKLIKFGKVQTKGARVSSKVVSQFHTRTFLCMAIF